MAKKVAEVPLDFRQDESAAWVTNLWTTYNNQRSGKVAEWTETRNYLFATDTTTTTNADLPWNNSTTLPKLCQIRDNLYSNYTSSLFPNDKWLKWEAYSRESAVKQKRDTIEAYMANKCRESHFRTEIGKILLDYIDYGNAFGTVEYVAEYKTLADGSVVPSYVGPRPIRISPLDIVFNPTATSFRDTHKIVRSLRTLGELELLAQDNPDQAFWAEAVNRRKLLQHHLGGLSIEDFDKSVGYSMDGFGSLFEYYQSEFVEVLEFYGDFRDTDSGVIKRNQIVTVVDRSFTARVVQDPCWFGTSSIFHVGWRRRPDNLWAMGPLDNLVGMQYRLDHLENISADAMDLLVRPPLAIVGQVEEFVWGPGCEIHINENGSIQELTLGAQGVVQADMKIRELIELMELMAGAPKEAAGIRTPGEKTAAEYLGLENAAGRIFQEKINHFETEMLEPLLNAMLEVAARNLDGTDVIRITDNSLGAIKFRDITKADITANGVIRPIGARHFAKQSQDLQNVISILQSPVGAKIDPHTSGVQLTEFVKDVTSLSNYDVFRPNIAVQEQADTQRVVGAVQEDMMAEAEAPV